MAKKQSTANGIKKVPINEVQQQGGDVVATSNDQIQAVAKQPKTDWFCCILYPEDPKHEAMLTYLKSRMPAYAHVLHDRDPVTQHDVDKHPWNEKTQTGYKQEDIGSLKKPHWHVVWQHYSKVRLKTARDLFSCWTKGVEACTDRVSYIYYLTHDDPISRTQGKAPYSWDEITIHGVGLERDLRQVKQNVYFVQFEEHGKLSVLLQEAKITNTADLYVFLAENRIETTLTPYELINLTRGVYQKMQGDIEKVTNSYERLCANQYLKIQELQKEIEKNG